MFMNVSPLAKLFLRENYSVCFIFSELCGIVYSMQLLTG